MRWQPRGRSRNLEDRRGVRAGTAVGGIGLGGVLLVVVLALVTKQDPIALLGGLAGGEPGAAAVAAPLEDAAEEREVEFVSYVLDHAQQRWSVLLPGMGVAWRDATLVLFRDQVASACGRASAASGPFYCPGDEKVYIDLSFYRELAGRFGAPGDFAEAYVLAHEIGHHVQALMGTNAAVSAEQRRRPDLANDLSVRLELQADCYAGVWGAAAAADGMLEGGDLAEGLGAAAAVGDDRLQRAAGATVQPESFTHGSSSQRMEWFRRGFDSGDPGRCDTFGAP